MRQPHDVLVFVRRADEVLVLRRSEQQGGYWHSVAGGVESGESAVEAARRELREETGLEAEPIDVDATFAYTPEAWEARAGSGPIRVDCFVVEVGLGWEPRLDWEHDAYRWCSPTDATDLLHWPEPRAVLRLLSWS